MVSLDDDTRDRGILTTRDREYLRGEREITEETAVNVRVAIRNRIRHALADFHLLTHNLPPKDRRLLLKANGNRRREEFLSDGVVAKSSDRGAGWLEQVVIFVYMVCQDWGLDFEALIERAVKRAETSVWFDGQFEKSDDVYDVDVTVDLRRNEDIDLDSAKARFEAGEYLSHGEVGALIRAGEIDGADLPQLCEEELPK